MLDPDHLPVKSREPPKPPQVGEITPARTCGTHLRTTIQATTPTLTTHRRPTNRV